MVKTVVFNEIDESYFNLFPEWNIVDGEFPFGDDAPEPDLLFLIGHSTDVDPSYYMEEIQPECGPVDQLQDEHTFNLIEEAHLRDIPIIGVCKGAQQLCVYKGGSLIQHVPRVGTHDILWVWDEFPTMITVRADHHQVMRPQGGRVWWLNVLESGEQYPEVVTWDEWDDLAIQWHPEWSPEGSDARRLWEQLLKKVVR